MNELKLVTKPTKDPKVFDTYWMTGLEKKGRVRTTVDIHDDCRIAAELSALQYLLEVKNVAGHDKAGAGLRLWVTFGAITKLMKEESDKSYLSPYANFLRTRFIGAQIVVENRKVGWADELCDRNLDELVVTKPSKTVIEIAGVGPAELSAHAVERYIERFERPAVRAWRDLIKLCKEALPARKKHQSARQKLNHRNESRYLLADNGVVLVVAAPHGPGMLPQLVTIETNEQNIFVAQC